MEFHKLKNIINGGESAKIEFKKSTNYKKK